MEIDIQQVQELWLIVKDMALIYLPALVKAVLIIWV
jgi:hypothetical protein